VVIFRRNSIAVVNKFHRKKAQIAGNVTSGEKPSDIAPNVGFNHSQEYKLPVQALTFAKWKSLYVAYLARDVT